MPCPRLRLGNTHSSSLAEDAGGGRRGPDRRDLPRPVVVRLGSRSRHRRELHGRSRPQAAAQLFRPSADRVVDGTGGGISDRQRKPGRRAAAVHCAVRGHDISDVPPDLGLVEPGGGVLGRGPAKHGAAFRYQQRQLGVAGWPAVRRPARGHRLPHRRIALGGPHSLGLVAGDRHVRRSGSVFQIFRGADHHRRRRLFADRAAQPSLAGEAAALRRRVGGIGDLSPST